MDVFVWLARIVGWLVALGLTRLGLTLGLGCALGLLVGALLAVVLAVRELYALAVRVAVWVGVMLR